MKDQNIDDMLLTEYKNIHQEDLPDLWSRIEGVIQSQDMEQDTLKQDADNTIHFAKPDKKRWIRWVGSIAACLLIAVGYVYINGDISPFNGDNDTPTESAATEAYMEEAVEAMTTAAAPADNAHDAAVESVGEESIEDFAEGLIYLKAQGLWYCYDRMGLVDASILTGKALLGETIPVETQDLPPHNLEITRVTVSCRVYADPEDERVVYVEVIETGEVYGFISIE